MHRALLASALLLGSASAEPGFDDRDRPRSNGANPPAEWAGADSVQTARIVGGAPVTPFEHNWVLQWRGGGYSCGASLIDEQWAMTAAHCTQGMDASDMQVRVHRHSRWDNNDEHSCAETISIAETFEHPDYISAGDGDDITLLRLSQPVGCVDSITMPSLDDGSYSGADTTVTVAGWGATSEGGYSSNVLHSVDLKLLTNAQCTAAQPYATTIADSMICAIGDLEGGEDSCQGDSGGPLFVQQAPSAPPSVALRGSSPPHPPPHCPHSSHRPPSRPHRGGMTSSSA